MEGLNYKVKFFSTACKNLKEVEKEVNEFCRQKIVVDIKLNDYKIMVIYKGN